MASKDAENPVTASVSAVILTGGRDLHNPLLVGTGLHSKVLLPVSGKPMLLRLYETLLQSKFSPDIYLSTRDPDIETLPLPGPRRIIPNEEKAVGSFLRAIQEAETDEWVFLVSGDHVLLTPEMVDYFIQNAMNQEFALAAAVVARATVQQAYPESKRTYFYAKNDGYSGGNMYLVNKRWFMGNPKVLETIDNNRKKPWKSVFMLDPITMLKILFRQLTMPEIATVASGLIGCRSGVVEMPFAECCMDVDKPSDFEIAELVLARRASMSSPAVPLAPGLLR